MSKFDTELDGIISLGVTIKRIENDKVVARQPILRDMIITSLKKELQEAVNRYLEE